MLKVYHVPGSRSVRAVWLAHELGIPFETVTMPFDLKVLRRPEYLAVSPLGRVPAISDGDVDLIESGAIAQYLTWKHPEAGLGRSPGDPEWHEWIQWIHFAETAAVHGASLVQQTVFVPPDQRSPIIDTLEGKRLLKAMEVIEARLEGRDWLLASGFSAADVCVGYSVHLGAGFRNLDHLPRVSDYYARIKARPAFQAATAGPSQARAS
jgi:glutathione S-transferase